MNLDNAKVQMRKGILEYCILSIISAREEAYASDILEVLKDARLLVVEGTLYPLLTRLKNSGMLSYEWKESTSGPPRKYYRLTARGKKFLHELDETWSELEYAVRVSVNNRKKP
ncbi:MAG: PadR family transcriptional regulator [Chitinophagales bacterium]|nr:MAG: PadR family transcriptional regulator [Chitinophagales bacterium]